MFSKFYSISDQRPQKSKFKSQVEPLAQRRLGSPLLNHIRAQLGNDCFTGIREYFTDGYLLREWVCKGKYVEPWTLAAVVPPHSVKNPTNEFWIVMCSSATLCLVPLSKSQTLLGNSLQRPYFSLIISVLKCTANAYLLQSVTIYRKCLNIHHTSWDLSNTGCIKALE